MGQIQPRNLGELARFCQDVEENIWPEEKRRDRRLEKMHNEELRNFYSSPNIIRMIMLRKMKFERHVA
jgi:acyl-coenzyme A synthetase/AMP-(fatty) acid ligase